MSDKKRKLFMIRANICSKSKEIEKNVSVVDFISKELVNMYHI